MIGVGLCRPHLFFIGRAQDGVNHEREGESKERGAAPEGEGAGFGELGECEDVDQRAKQPRGVLVRRPPSPVIYRLDDDDTEQGCGGEGGLGIG